jgi:transcription antitermination factor NusG
MSGIKAHWYAVYTKPRWEKKVHQLLSERGLEAYCPVNRIRKKWSDRIKWVDVPLFTSYVFVRVPETEQEKVRGVNGVVNFVYWLGKPAVIKDKEIEAIRNLLDEYREIRVEPFNFQANARVIVRRGVFMDKEATIMKVINNKVKVVIESIGYTLIAVIDKSNVKGVNK